MLPSVGPMTLSPEQAEQAAARAASIVAAVEGFIQGKRETVELSLTCLLAQGHLLIEDVPGVGKTSLARSLATALGMSWHRIQFTPDLLPSDVTGVSVFDQVHADLRVPPGADLRQHRARRRDQPGVPARPSRRCSRSWRNGTSPIDGPAMRCRETVPGHGDAEPDRAGRHLPAARGSARPVHARCKISIGYPDADGRGATWLWPTRHDGVRIEALPPSVTSSRYARLIDAAKSVFVDRP